MLSKFSRVWLGTFKKKVKWVDNLLLIFQPDFYRTVVNESDSLKIRLKCHLWIGWSQPKCKSQLKATFCLSTSCL